MIKELTCIRCPIGCSLQVEMNGDEVVNVTGNNCPRGAEYARKELGMLTLKESCMELIEQGLTTVEELVKVAYYD